MRDLLGIGLHRFARLAQAVEQGAGFSGPSIAGTGLPRMGARSEYMGRVRPESLRPLPWLPGVANRMTRYMARTTRCRNPPQDIGWQMNYPYAMQWFGTHGGLRGVARVEHWLGVDMPMLYIYGRRKPFMFHSASWLEQLARAPGSEVLALDTGHWVMRQKPAEFNACVRAWLDRSVSPS